MFMCRQTVCFVLVSTPIQWNVLELFALIYMIIYLKNSNCGYSAGDPPTHGRPCSRYYLALSSFHP